MRKVFLVAVVAVAVLGAFFAGRYFGMSANPSGLHFGSSTGAGLESESFYLKGLIVLVDDHEFYCGHEKVPSAAAEDYIIKTMELNKVRSVFVSASVNSTYGEVVSLVDRLRARGVKAITVDVSPVLHGTRLSLLTSDDWRK